MSSEQWKTERNDTMSSPETLGARIIPSSGQVDFEPPTQLHSPESQFPANKFHELLGKESVAQISQLVNSGTDPAILGALLVAVRNHTQAELKKPERGMVHSNISAIANETGTDLPPGVTRFTRELVSSVGVLINWVVESREMDGVQAEPLLHVLHGIKRYTDWLAPEDRDKFLGEIDRQLNVGRKLCVDGGSYDKQQYAVWGALNHGLEEDWTSESTDFQVELLRVSPSETR